MRASAIEMANSDIGRLMDKMYRNEDCTQEDVAARFGVGTPMVNMVFKVIGTSYIHSKRYALRQQENARAKQGTSADKPLYPMSDDEKWRQSFLSQKW